MSQQVKVYRELQFFLGGAKKIAFSVNSSGNVEIKDASGNIIGTLDAVNRKLTLPSGAVLDVSAATGSIVFAAGEIDTADLASNAVTTVKITDANVTQAKIAEASLDGTVAKVVAASNVIGGIPVLHRISAAAGDNADHDVILTHKEQVIDAWIVLAGAGVASAVITVKNAINAITDTMAASGADATLVRAATIDDANHEIVAGGTLRVTTSGGTTAPAFICYVLAVRVA